MAHTHTFGSLPLSLCLSHAHTLSLSLIHSLSHTRTPSLSQVVTLFHNDGTEEDIQFFEWVTSLYWAMTTMTTIGPAPNLTDLFRI